MESKLRNLWQETRDLTLGTTIDRLPAAPTPLPFLRDYVSHNKPCIIPSSYTKSWPSISLWPDPTYLLGTLSSSLVSLHLTPTGRADSLSPNPSDPTSLCFASAASLSLKFEDALAMIDSSATSSAVAYAQQQNDCFRSEYAPLVGDIEPHIPWATEAFGGTPPEAVNLWIGNEKSETSFHKDHYENIYVVVTGEKHFLLLPPTEVHRMYVREYPVAVYVVGKDCFDLRLEMEVPRGWCLGVVWIRIQGRRRRCRGRGGSSLCISRGRNHLSVRSRPGRFCICRVCGFIMSGRARVQMGGPSLLITVISLAFGFGFRWVLHREWKWYQQFVLGLCFTGYDMQFDIKYAYFNFLQSIEYLDVGSCEDGEDEDLDHVDVEDS